MKTVCRVLSAAILIIFILLYLPLTVPQLFGYDCSAVVSASMEPAIKTGSLVYFSPADPQTLAEGDVIVFRSSYGADVSDVCHRIVTNDTEKQSIVTKGDANSNNDFVPVSYDLVRGKVLKVIPFGGNIALFLTSVGGKRSMAGLLLPAILLHIAGSSAEKRPKRR